MFIKKFEVSKVWNSQVTCVKSNACLGNIINIHV